MNFVELLDLVRMLVVAVPEAVRKQTRLMNRPSLTGNPPHLSSVNNFIREQLRLDEEV